MRELIKGKTANWEYVIGLEVHCQVTSKAKLFSGASTAFGAAPNSQVSFVDAAMPGMLPVLNEECVAQAVKTAIGLNAEINKVSVFDRKSYFYADLPTGYQISQFFKPIMGNGWIEVALKDGSTKRIEIERMHLEQDAGKSMHDQHPKKTFIDINRAGVALMEIVTKPVLTSPEEAGEYLRKLRSIVRYLGTCDGNMDEGSMRCDANVSVRKEGDTILGTRVEIKNINSVKFVMQAIEFEAKRQIEALENGETLIQETRLYDSIRGETRQMRTKEFAEDYRYYPDPDLLPLVLSDEYIENIRQSLPELPDVKKDRFLKEYHLSDYDASILCADREVADYFEIAAKNNDAKKVANWIIGELFAFLNKEYKSISQSPVSAENLGKLVALITNNTISGKIAKDVFEIMLETGENPEKIVEEKGLKQVSDTGEIEKIVDEVIASSPENVASYKAGKDKLLGWFVGQAMKASKGKANPSMLNDMIKQKLDN